MAHLARNDPVVHGPVIFESPCKTQNVLYNLHVTNNMQSVFR